VDVTLIMCARAGTAPTCSGFTIRLDAAWLVCLSNARNKIQFNGVGGLRTLISWRPPPRTRWLWSGKERRVSMAQKANFTPVDKYESDRREAERLDFEKHARLEADLIDTFPASDPVSATQSARQPLSIHTGKAHRSGRRSRRCSVASIRLTRVPFVLARYIFRGRAGANAMLGPPLPRRVPPSFRLLT
jgi:hypothetical protein